METVLILGGYGAVGRAAAAALLTERPGIRVIAAGRDPARAAPVPGSEPKRLDAADTGAVVRALEGVDAVLMCAEANNVEVARACLERGVGYLDVTATHTLLAELADLDGLARDHGATAVLSLGLAPGVTNLLAAHGVACSGGEEVRIGVLLGSGERHGPAGVRWVLDRLGGIGEAWREEFPAPYGQRTVHGFPFSDQYTLPRTLGIARVRTGLCLDSRMMTGLLGSARRAPVARLLDRPRARALLRFALSEVHLGGDGFALSATAGGHRATFAGRRQSSATGVAAALLTLRLPGMPPGVRHIEQLVEPQEFLAELAARGFALDLNA